MMKVIYLGRTTSRHKIHYGENLFAKRPNALVISFYRKEVCVGTCGAKNNNLFVKDPEG